MYIYLNRFVEMAVCSNLNWTNSPNRSLKPQPTFEYHIYITFDFDS